MSVIKSKRNPNTHYDLQVLNDLRELAIHTIVCCKNESVFPKSCRWIYTRRLTDEAIDALLCAVKANSIKISEDDNENLYKYRYSQQIQSFAHLESLKVLLDLAYDLVKIEGRRVDYWAGLIVDARKKLQAWIRSDKKRYTHPKN